MDPFLSSQQSETNLVPPRGAPSPGDDSASTEPGGSTPSASVTPTDEVAAAEAEKKDRQKRSAVWGYCSRNKGVPYRAGQPVEQAFCNYCVEKGMSHVLNGRPDVLLTHLLQCSNLPNAVKLSFGKGAKRRAHRSASKNLTKA